MKSCDHGTYTLSYSLSEPGRYLLYVKVAGQPLNGGPSRVTVAPGAQLDVGWRMLTYADVCLKRRAIARNSSARCSVIRMLTYADVC